MQQFHQLVLQSQSAVKTDRENGKSLYSSLSNFYLFISH